MKKIIFLLLLAQTISFLSGNSHCLAHKQVTGNQGIASDKDDPLAWRWGSKSPKHVKCYCNCAQYPKANYTCLGCGHKNLPIDLKLSINKNHVPSNKMTTL